MMAMLIFGNQGAPRGKQHVFTNHSEVRRLWQPFRSHAPFPPLGVTAVFRTLASKEIIGIRSADVPHRIARTKLSIATRADNLRVVVTLVNFDLKPLRRLSFLTKRCISTLHIQ
ncbi:hypothetical protein PMIN06_005225 [Paraphaeosphaeria minitans]